MHKIKTLFNAPEIVEPQKASIKVGKTPIEIALGVDRQGRTTAKRLYAFLELDETHYSRWCKRNITENDFAEEREDYFYSPSMASKRGRGNFAEDYLLTATFAKKLAMASNSVRGEQAREHFIKVEEQLKKVVLSMESFRQEPGMLQRESRVSLNEMILLNKMQAITRYNLGSASIQRVAAECGAIVHIGRRVVFHRQILDDYFERMAER